MLKLLLNKTVYFVCCLALLGVTVYGAGYRFTHAARDAAAAPKPQRTVYLTFDDGPSSTTAAVLAALEQEGVRATFFVTAQYEEYFSLMTEADAAGHVVAPHTASHRFSQIYKSSEAFWADQKKINDIIFTYTAKTPALLRFAGGSSNTVSFPYGGRGLMKQLARECAERGIEYHDWNVDSGDWQNNRSSASITDRVLRGVRQCVSDSIVVLFHDSPSAPGTPQALAQIISALKAEGYAFDTLDNLSTPAHHGFP